MSVITRTIKIILPLIALISISIFSGCVGKGGNPIIPGVQGPALTYSNNKMIISTIIDDLPLEMGARYNVPKYSQSYIEIAPDLASKGTMLSISISLDDIKDTDTLQQLDSHTLPGGRALPGITEGTLPAIAFTIDNFKNMVFYTGENAWGVFIPVQKLSIPVTATLKFHAGELSVGEISLISPDEEGNNAGILLMLSTTKENLKLLKKNGKYLKGL